MAEVPTSAGGDDASLEGRSSGSVLGEVIVELSAGRADSLSGIVSESGDNSASLGM
jgi:hypothetical protein